MITLVRKCDHCGDKMPDGCRNVVSVPEGNLLVRGKVKDCHIDLHGDCAPLFFVDIFKRRYSEDEKIKSQSMAGVTAGDGGGETDGESRELAGPLDETESVS